MRCLRASASVALGAKRFFDGGEGRLLCDFESLPVAVDSRRLCGNLSCTETD